MSPIIKTVAQGFVVISILAFVGFIAQKGGLGGILNQEWINIYVSDSGLTGKLIYLGAAGLFAAAGLPRQIISFLAGYAFGLSMGVLLALTATTIGCVICFYIARFVGRDTISKRFPRKVKNADSFLRENTFAMTLLIRLFPLGSNFATNLAAGISSSKAQSFISGSLIGYIPQTAIFALLGSGISLDPELRISLSFILFAISAALGIYLFRVFQQSKK